MHFPCNTEFALDYLSKYNSRYSKNHSPWSQAMCHAGDSTEMKPYFNVTAPVFIHKYIRTTILRHLSLSHHKWFYHCCFSRCRNSHSSYYVSFHKTSGQKQSKRYGLYKWLQFYSSQLLSWDQTYVHPPQRCRYFVVLNKMSGLH